jgi:predicted TIM-barrel fold metal-dependent hydrolase
MPATMGPQNPAWLAAYRALYDYPRDDLEEAHVGELRDAMKRARSQQGAKFPEWVLDRIGIETMFANRIAMGPGLESPRFRWVSFADPLMLPLSKAPPGRVTPDREKLAPYEAKLLERYLKDLGLTQLPATLDEYLAGVVDATLERQRKAGCIAVKFEAAYLRSLDFEDSAQETASTVYSRYVKGNEPSPEAYKALQDFLFRHIAREAGRLGMAVHVHSFEGAGAFYDARGADPLLLESVFNDPTLRQTNFVIVHGGGMYADHAAAMFWKPNVYVDNSAMGLLYPTAALADVLLKWLRQDPERVLFGTDASSFGPELGWEVTAWVGTTHTRQALGMALTEMMRLGEISRSRAEEIATLVLRGNAAKLYGLSSK